MKKLALVSAISLAASGQAMAAAYKLPESSINGTALSAAYVANAQGADASYYNPAAMAFNEGGAKLETALTVIHLTGIEFTDAVGAVGNDETKSETIGVPTFHYTSRAMGNMRFGLSVVSPGGLTKRWRAGAEAFAEEFTLKTLEFNPTIGVKVNDQFAIGAGLRAIYSEGVVKSSNSAFAGVPLGRDLEGDSWDFGYNLALHYKPTSKLQLSATYRSKIDLTEEGEATLNSAIGIPSQTSGASVTIPIPAAVSIAAAYDFTDKTTIELVLERTYWSSYEELDFNYTDALIHPAYSSAFDASSPKNWKDSNTVRIGVTHRPNDKWTVMGGFAYDKTPVPEHYAGFELPDSDAFILSFGAKYKYSNDLTFGAAFLFDKKQVLDLTTNHNPVLTNATFRDASAYLVTVGMEYSF
jgi:long-chain fatty acid transport protein